MKAKPFLTITSTGTAGIHNYRAFMGGKRQRKLLLQNSLEATIDVFGRRDAKAMAKRVFGL